MRKKPEIFKIGSYEIEYSRTYPLVNGKSIVGKEAVVKFFCQVLRDIEYTFDPFQRPTPSILVNWRDIDGGFLRRWIKKCFTQITLIPIEVIRLSVLDIDGFCMKDDSTNINYQLVHVLLSAQEYRNEITCTIGNVSAIVQRFMSSHYVDKKIVIN